MIQVKKEDFRGHISMKSMSKHMGGSMVLEAALVFPWLIAVILPFLYLVYGLVIQNMLEVGLEQGLREIAVESYLLERLSMLPAQSEREEEVAPTEPEEVQELEGILTRYKALKDPENMKEILEEEVINIAGRYLLKEKVKDYIQEEKLHQWGILNGWDGISFVESRFFYSKEGRKRLIKGVISFEWNIDLPFWSLPSVKIERVYHTFVGEDTNFGQEKTEGSAALENLVYRIGQGIHYHSLDCYLIQKDIISQVRQQAQREGRKSCERCSPQQKVIVYMTSKGERYHTKECTYLYPQLSSMHMEEALERGYTGCGLCQEGKGNFS